MASIGPTSLPKTVFHIKASLCCLPLKQMLSTGFLLRVTLCQLKSHFCWNSAPRRSERHRKWPYIASSHGCKIQSLPNYSRNWIIQDRKQKTKKQVVVESRQPGRSGSSKSTFTFILQQKSNQRTETHIPWCSFVF